MFKVKARTITLVLLGLLLSLSPQTAAQAAGEIDIASVDSCPVSMKNIWGPHGLPYPCFADGSILKVQVPVQKNPQSSTLAVLNGETFSVTAGTFFTFPRYTLGLNEVSFVFQHSESSQSTQSSIKKFIVYTPQTSLRLRTLSISKTAYAITPAEGISPDQVIALLGIAQNEYLLKGLQGTDKGYSAKVLVADLSDAQYSLASSTPLITQVNREGLVQASDIQTGATWGLDRIDQRNLPLNGNFQYDFSGRGVDVYIVDSGIREDHTEFAGRITASMHADTFTSVSDCNGHGTHVAGTAAGTTYGVAKSANIIPVRVLDCAGSGTMSDIQAGVNWIISRHTTTTPAVVNFSLGGSYNLALNNLMQSLINDGVVTVVAAGNEGETLDPNACDYSPASAPNAITVAASTSVDQDASFSNIGSCVDLFAPGVNITSAWIDSNASINTISGTSMAAPHVAGVAASILEEKFSSFANKANANALIADLILQRSTPNILTTVYASPSSWYATTPNRLLNLPFRQAQSALTFSAASSSGTIATPIPLSASGGSGTGQVSFSVDSGTCKTVGSNLVAFDSGTCVVKATKALDDSYTAISSNTSNFTFSDLQTHGPWKAVSVGWGTTCAIKKTTGTLYCWGENDYGQIARAVVSAGTVNSTPLPVTSIPGSVTQVSVGAKFACAVNSLNNLYCWGKNASGQLGNNTFSSSSSPETVTTLNGNVKSVSAGNNSTCAVTLDGKIYCWGDGLNGKLGNGSTSSSKVPVQVSNISSGATDVSLGDDHVCAIVSGAAKCWGSGLSGALGNGLATDSNIPVNVSGLSSGVTKISSGYQQSCAVKSISIYCWGYNQYGTIGDGTTTQRNSPVSLTGSYPELKDINVGRAVACGINANSGLLCWGNNTYSQVGNNSDVANQLTPSAVKGLASSIKAVSSSVYHSCALAKYGRLFCWGDNSFGQLGNGDSITSVTAFQSSQLDYNLNAPLNPLLSETLTARTLNSIRLQVSNYDPTFIWSVSSSSETATASLDSAGLVTVTGLAPAESVTVTTNASKNTYETGTTTSATFSTLSLGRVPTFDTNTATSLSNGFRINISNYDSNYQWSGISSRESATVTISDTGTVTVSGINPGTSSTITITTFRSGYSSESATTLSYNSLTGYGLVPVIDSTTATSTADGFTVNITNFDPAYSWSGQSTVNGGSVSISNTGVITMSGIAPDTSSRAVVTTSRAGYYSRSETTTALSSLKAGLITTFDTKTPTADGFTIQITNINNLYSYSVSSTFNGGLATIDTTTGLVTATNISTGTPSRIRVTTSRSGYANVITLSDTVTSIPSAVATLSALTINGTNVLPQNSSVTVGNGVTSVSPVVTPTNAFATWVIESATGLVTGSNLILITVTSQDQQHIETYTVTVVVSSPPAPAPAPAPAPTGGGGGGVGTTWFNLFISSPDDPMQAYAGEACALFILKADDGDKQFGPICATKSGALDYEANDGNYLIRTYDKTSPKNFKEYKAKVTFGTFEVTGAGYRGGSVPRRVITVLKPSEYAPDPLATPTPTPTVSTTPATPSVPADTAAVTPSPTPTASVTAQASKTMANNGLISTTPRTSTTKSVSVTSTNTALSLKKSGTLALSVKKIPAKSAITVIVTLPTGEKITTASIKSYTKATYSMPALAFSKSGNYEVTFKIGKNTRTVKIKVS